MPDSTADTTKHQERVQALMTQAIMVLSTAAMAHDQSKLEEPEKSTFDWAGPRLKHLPFGTPQYAKAKEDMGSALTHHYAVNRHHPEHHPNGIHDMDLLDLIEMLSDWKAAGERHKDSKGLAYSIAVGAENYGYGELMTTLLTNTAKRLGWIEA